MSARRTTVRSLSGKSSRFNPRSAISRALSTDQRSVTNRHLPTSWAPTRIAPDSSKSTTSACPGSDSTSS
ncbi:Uncharacterised protein [Mycobacteroides abscessus subsp. abscessus]|nr:Uncharacterised protein [Mycobacteroides abscessus subsp. abscessus]